MSTDETKDLSKEDWKALLSFPYSEYASDVKIKREVDDYDQSSLRSVTKLPLKREAEGNGTFTRQDAQRSEDNFDSEAQKLENCFSQNLAYQKKLVENMNKVQATLEWNLAKQESLRDFMKTENKSKKDRDERTDLKPISLFAAPYFRDTRGMVPPDNEDTKAKRKEHILDAYLSLPRPWISAENAKLFQGVSAAALDAVIRPHRTKRDFIKNKLKDSNLLDFEIDVLKKQLLNIEKKIKRERTRPIHEVIDEMRDKIDWMKISATNMEGTRSPEECQSMWNNYLDIAVTKDAFSAEEDAKLKKLAIKYSERDWDAVAKSLGTGRTAIQCIERYQTTLNENLTRSFWTPEEDEKLLKTIDALKIGNVIPWNKVSSYMEGRTRQQLINRYERSISTEIAKGPWTNEEDAMLIACEKKFGTQWRKMKPFLKKRSSYACRERYTNTLDPTLKIGGWSREEDRVLIQLIKKHGYGKWAKICRELPGRTDNMCLMRSQCLIVHSAEGKRFTNKKDFLGDIDDPEPYIKTLKPGAPTKGCQSQNCKLDNVRKSAFETLLHVLKKLQPETNFGSDIVNLDLSSVSIPMLYRIHDELSKMKKLSEKDENHKRRYKRKCHAKPKPDFSSEDNVSDEKSDFSEDEISEEKEQFNEDDKSWLENVLSAMFEEAAASLPTYMTKRVVVMNTRESAEFTLYKSYLSQQFQCENTDCDENENFTFCGVDYSVTLADIVYHFVQPPIAENQFIVLAPNLTTMGAMEVLIATKLRLTKMSNFVQHSKPYVEYLFGSTKNGHKCLYCRLQSKELNNANTENRDVILNAVKKELFMVDVDLEKAILAEYEVPEEMPNKCTCDHLSKSRNAVSLLRKRFLSLFLWPMLLSSHEFSEEQYQVLIDSSASKYIPSSIPSTKRGKKRAKKPKRQKADVTSESHLNGEISMNLEVMKVEESPCGVNSVKSEVVQQIKESPNSMTSINVNEGKISTNVVMKDLMVVLNRKQSTTVADLTEPMQLNVESNSATNSGKSSTVLQFTKIPIPSPTETVQKRKRRRTVIQTDSPRRSQRMCVLKRQSFT